MSENDMAKIARLATALTLLDEIAALRARVAELEEVIQTQNGVVVSGTLKLNEARARVAKLEEELADARKWILAALSETVEA